MTAPDVERVREIVRQGRAEPAFPKFDVLQELFVIAEAWLAAQEREHHEPLAQSACAAVRELLNDAGVPTAAFIDDHVGNLIVLHKQAQERIAELEARLRSSGDDYEDE